MVELLELTKRANDVHKGLKKLNWKNTANDLEANLLLMDEDNLADVLQTAKAINRGRVKYGSTRGKDLCVSSIYEAVSPEMEEFQSKRMKAFNLLASFNWNRGDDYIPKNLYSICSRLANCENMQELLMRIAFGRAYWKSKTEDENVYYNHSKGLLRLIQKGEEIEELVERIIEMSEAFLDINYKETPETYCILAELVKNGADANHLVHRTDQFRNELIQTGRSASLDLTFTAALITANNCDTGYFIRRYAQIFTEIKSMRHNDNFSYLKTGMLALLPVSVDRILQDYKSAYSALRKVRGDLPSRNLATALLKVYYSNPSPDLWDKIAEGLHEANSNPLLEQSSKALGKLFNRRPGEESSFDDIRKTVKQYENGLEVTPVNSLETFAHRLLQRSAETLFEMRFDNYLSFFEGEGPTEEEIQSDYLSEAEDYFSHRLDGFFDRSYIV